MTRATNRTKKRASREAIALEEIAALLRGVRADQAAMVAAIRRISDHLERRDPPTGFARYGVIRGEVDEQVAREE